MYGNMTVYEAMDYLGVLSGLSKQERRERIPELLERVNLQNNHRTKVKAMSGGMRRRLGIAQAILHDPKVLIVDEPTALCIYAQLRVKEKSKALSRRIRRLLFVPASVLQGCFQCSSLPVCVGLQI